MSEIIAHGDHAHEVEGAERVRVDGRACPHVADVLAVVVEMLCAHGRLTPEPEDDEPLSPDVEMRGPSDESHP